MLTVRHQICHVDEEHNPSICEATGKYIQRYQQQFYYRYNKHFSIFVVLFALYSIINFINARC